MIKRLTTALVMISLSAQAGSDKFAFFYTDGYVDRYDSATSSFTRRACDGPDHHVSFSFDREAIKRLRKLSAQIDFFRLSERLENDSGASKHEFETISVCGGCPDSTLRISKGRKSHTVEWRCDCEVDGAVPKEVEPLVREIRHMLYGNPAIAGLPASACVFY
jgi:hypothetical protein